MYDDDNQIQVPASFIQLFSSPSGRPRLPLSELRERYELCEDLACQLTSQAQQLCHGQGLPEERVLAQIHAGLASPDSGLDARQAWWVTVRLAELLQWRSPALEPPQGAV